MKNNILLMMAGIAPLLSACGGSGDNPPPALVETALCPSSLDYGTIYTGGSGSGELIKLQIDTTKLLWQITYIDSPIPQTTGTAVPTRTGTKESGTLTRETQLPTQKLNSCAYRLNDASLDPTRPARVFVGSGVVGGVIPGKRVSFAGLFGQGAVRDTTFPYYPFVGFSSIETDLAKLAGTYSQIGYGQVPSQNFAPTTINATVTINANGTWTRCDTTGIYAGFCRQPGTNISQSSDGSGAFRIGNYQGQVKPTSATTPQAKGYVIVGRLRGQLVPIVVRTGVVNPTMRPDTNGIPGPTADDESGISILAPLTTLSSGSQNGEYVGVDSQFNYRTTALADTQATLLDPFAPSQASLATALNLDYTQKVPGSIKSTRASASSATPTGTFIFTGGVFGFLDTSTSSLPYFTIGAFVQ